MDNVNTSPLWRVQYGGIYVKFELSDRHRRKSLQKIPASYWMLSSRVVLCGRFLVGVSNADVNSLITPDGDDVGFNREFNSDSRIGICLEQ
jgi:hypothetical protein